MTKKIVIDKVEYALEDLSSGARQQVANLRGVDQEIARLQRQMAIARTARNAFARALKVELAKGKTPQTVN